MREASRSKQPRHARTAHEQRRHQWLAHEWSPVESRLAALPARKQYLPQTGSGLIPLLAHTVRRWNLEVAPRHRACGPGSKTRPTGSALTDLPLPGQLRWLAAGRDRLG